MFTHPVPRPGPKRAKPASRRCACHENASDCKPLSACTPCLARRTARRVRSPPRRWPNGADIPIPAGRRPRDLIPKNRRDGMHCVGIRARLNGPRRERPPDDHQSTGSRRRGRRPLPGPIPLDDGKVADGKVADGQSRGLARWHGARQIPRPAARRSRPARSPGRRPLSVMPQPLNVANGPLKDRYVTHCRIQGVISAPSPYTLRHGPFVAGQSRPATRETEDGFPPSCLWRTRAPTGGLDLDRPGHQKEAKVVGGGVRAQSGLPCPAFIAPGAGRIKWVSRGRSGSGAIRRRRIRYRTRAPGPPARRRKHRRAEGDGRQCGG